MPNLNPEDREGWLTIDEMIERIEAKRAGRTLREFAAHLGVISFQQLGAMLGRQRPPAKSLVQKLGYKAIVVYAPIVVPKKKVSKL